MDDEELSALRARWAPEAWTRVTLGVAPALVSGSVALRQAYADVAVLLAEVDRLRVVEAAVVAAVDAGEWLPRTVEQALDATRGGAS